MRIIDVSSQRRIPGVRAAAVRHDARRVLELLGAEGELSIALIGDAEMRKLNAAYRRKDWPTDVLSFPSANHLFPPSPLPRARRSAPSPHPVLGDVVISLDTARRQAAERGITVGEEVRTLLVHGILHLLGYDHERSPAEARRMFAKQRRLLAILRRSPS